jgi:protein ImuA
MTRPWRLARKPALARLKAKLAEIAPPAAVALQAPPEALALRPAALNEIRAADWRDAPAALGFALSLAGKRSRETGKAVIALSLLHEARREGALFGRGLSACGISLSSLLVAFARDETMLLWAAEEAARSAGVAAILIEAPHVRLDLTATRRLHLAAEASGASPILIRGASGHPSAAAARWRVAARPSAADPYDRRGLGKPRLYVELERCRKGGRGIFKAEWSDDEEAFVAVHEPLSAALADRSPEAAERALARGERTAHRL